MTLLPFSIDGRLYGIDLAAVEAVVPLAPLRPLDLAPEWVSGIADFFGEMVPVVDLTLVHAGRPSRRAYSTRLVVVRHAGRMGQPRLLGLVAEGVTDVAEVDVAGLQPTGVRVDAAPWLGQVGPDDAGRLLQIVDVERLLPADVREALFP